MTPADREAAETLHAIARLADLPDDHLLLAVMARPSQSASHAGWYDIVVDPLNPAQTNLSYADPACFVLLGDTPDADGWRTAWVWVKLEAFGKLRGRDYVKVNNWRDHAAADTHTNPPFVRCNVWADQVVGFRPPDNPADLETDYTGFTITT